MGLGCNSWTIPVTLSPSQKLSLWDLDLVLSNLILIAMNQDVEI